MDPAAINMNLGIFAQRWRWFPEGTIRELIETGRRVYFRKNSNFRPSVYWSTVEQRVKHQLGTPSRLCDGAQSNAVGAPGSRKR